MLREYGVDMAQGFHLGPPAGFPSGRQKQVSLQGG